MKKGIVLVIFLAAAFSAYAQRLSSVGILPFEFEGSGVNEAEAEEAAILVAEELASWGTLNVLFGEGARNAEYLVRGKIAREAGGIVLSAVTYETGSGKSLNSSKEAASALGTIPLFSFCAQIAENIPFPNYLAGTWRSTIDMPDGPLTCVMEFRENRSVRAFRFDTWEYSGTSSLKYQATGSGTYSYAGFLRRTVTIGGRQIQSDASAGIFLSLEDALPDYASVNARGLRILFDDSRESFEIVSGGIPCGKNLGGPRIYPALNVYYTRFVRVE